MLPSGAVRIFSRTDRSWARLYRVYPKSAESTSLLLLSTPKKYFFVRVKCEFIIFPGKFFWYVLQTKMVIPSGSKNNVSLRHSPRHLLPGGEPCILYNCHFFFSSGISLRAYTFVRNVGWMWCGHNSTVEVTMPEVWARSVQCVARGKPFKLFWSWAHLRQIPGFPQHPRGSGLCIPIPVYARKILMHTGFFCS